MQSITVAAASVKNLAGQAGAIIETMARWAGMASESCTNLLNKQGSGVGDYCSGKKKEPRSGKTNPFSCFLV